MKFIVNTNLDGMSWIDISIYNNEKLLKNEKIMTLKEALDFSEEKNYLFIFAWMKTIIY